MLFNGLFSLLCKLFPSQSIVAQWNAFCFLEAKRSLACMPNKPLQYVIAEHVISICTPEHKDSVFFEQPLWFLSFEYFQIPLGYSCNVLNNPNGYYEYLSVFLRISGGPFVCTLMVPALCWIHSVPKSQDRNPIRDTWLVELIRDGVIVFHLWIKSHGPVS